MPVAEKTQMENHSMLQQVYQKEGGRKMYSYEIRKEKQDDMEKVLKTLQNISGIRVAADLEYKRRLSRSDDNGVQTFSITIEEDDDDFETMLKAWFVIADAGLKENRNIRDELHLSSLLYESEPDCADIADALCLGQEGKDRLVESILREKNMFILTELCVFGDHHNFLTEFIRNLNKFIKIGTGLDVKYVITKKMAGWLKEELKASELPDGLCCIRYE